MHGPDRTLRALQRRLATSLALLSDQELIQLHNLLLGLGRIETEQRLRMHHRFAVDFLCRTTASTRREALQLLPRPKALFGAYAAAAWAYRTLRLFEAIEQRRDGLLDVQRWAGFSAMELLQHHEEDESWLWPYATRSPFEPL